MGQASLAAPPQDFLATTPKSVPNQAPVPGEDDSEAPPAETPLAASPGSLILHIQEDGTLFQKGAKWVGVHSPAGYDLTDAAGNICSGRPAGLGEKITPGERIALACSDGRSATLLITEAKATGAAGQVTIGQERQATEIIHGN